MKLNILPRENGKTAKTKVIHALQQAQKQEKLLELYKDLSNYVCEECYSYKLPEITLIGRFYEGERK